MQEKIQNQLAFRPTLLAVLLSAMLAPAVAQTQAPASSSDKATSAAAAPQSEDWNWHVQATSMSQKHGSFTAPFSGPNSLPASEGVKSTFDATLFLGLRLWSGAEFYLNPEFDQGFGLGDTLGLAGFSSGAAYKVGHQSPYAKLPRAFVRQTFALGDSASDVESGPNQLAGRRADDRVTLTLGKFSVTDIFDTNSYAHDPRADFANWSILDGGAFDYAADSWGYSVGAAADWTQGAWSLRGGLFAMSKQPNGETLQGNFSQRQWVGELEHRHSWGGRPGAVRLLAFWTQAKMARYADILAQQPVTGSLDPVGLRKPDNKHGFMLNMEQELAQDIGAFARFSVNDGRTEAYDFTDINHSLSGGVQIKGSYWQQPSHTLGVALAVNGLSNSARQFFQAGGTGILVGDGQLKRYGREQIFETYYAVKVHKSFTLAGDFQHVQNPAYNMDRGPVNIWGLRLHAEY